LITRNARLRGRIYVTHGPQANRDVRRTEQQGNAEGGALQVKPDAVRCSLAFAGQRVAAALDRWLCTV